MTGKTEFKPKWLLLNNGWYWVVIQKNAQTSIKEHAVDHKWRVPKGKKVAVIRNPYDRLVSCYENRKADFGNVPWQMFIDHVCKTPDDKINAHARSQHINLVPWPDILVPFDRINEYFIRIGIELKHRNESKRGDWRKYYTGDQLEIVKARYRQDFEIWEQLETKSPEI